MEEELNRYMRILRNFGRIYTQKIASGSSNIKSDLRVSQIKALFAFKDAHCLSMKELAENVGVKLSNMTMMIDTLIKDGIAERDRDDSDRRKVMVRLTPQGEKIRAQFLAHRRKVAKSIFSHLTEEDKQKLLNSFETVCNILGKIS
ncbi:MAG: MarR family transcriptional regulator [Proteobacteria bacterium]|nr:MarR family transcriptional regulator [Pseudomonadota bacterium]